MSGSRSTWSPGTAICRTRRCGSCGGESWGWAGLQAFSVFCTALLPFFSLLSGRIRSSPAALAWLGAPVLVGVLAHLCWVVGPAFGPMALPAAGLSVLAVGGIWLGLTYGPVVARLARAPHDA